MSGKVRLVSFIQRSECVSSREDRLGIARPRMLRGSRSEKAKTALPKISFDVEAWA